MKSAHDINMSAAYIVLEHFKIVDQKDALVKKLYSKKILVIADRYHVCSDDGKMCIVCVCVCGCDIVELEE